MINMNPVLFLENKPVNNVIISGSFDSFSMHDDIIQEMELAQYNYNNAVKQLEILISEQDTIMNNNRLYYRPLTEGLAGDAVDVVTSAIDAIIGFITNMFSKFFMSVNKIIGRDAKWYQKYKNTILSSNFKLPAADDKFSNWKDYKLDRIKKSLIDKSFSENDKQLLDMLSDDAKKFEDDIFRRIGGSRGEIDSNITDFKAQCEYLYSGPDKDVDVSIVQNNIKTYFEFCADFLTGKNSSVYNTIAKDSKKLDESKRNVMEAINKKVQGWKGIGKNTSNTPQEQSQPSSGSTGADKAAGGEESTQGTSSNDESAMIFDIASYYKLRSIYEVDGTESKSEDKNNDGGGAKMQTPEVKKDDESKKDVSDELTELKEKALKFFKLTGNAIGAQMSSAVQAYNQYNKLFRWAIKNQGGNDNNTENKADTGDNNNKENKTNNDDQKKNNNTKNEKIVGNAIQRLNQAKNREKS